MGENMNVPILLAVASLIAGGLVAFTSQFGVRNGADECRCDDGRDRRL